MRKAEVLEKEGQEVEKILEDLEEMVVDLGPKMIENLDQGEIRELLQEKRFLLEGLESEVVRSVSAQKKIYSQRLASVEGELNRRLSARRRICQAWRLGYSPFTVNKAWHGGFLEKPSPERLIKHADEKIVRVHEHKKKKIRTTVAPYFLFQQAIPKHVLEKYQKAKGLGIFDVLMVYSPREDDFLAVEKTVRVEVEVTRLPRPKIDPILEGYIGLDGVAMVDKSEIKALGDKYVSFLIAAWDLGKDLKFLES